MSTWEIVLTQVGDFIYHIAPALVGVLGGGFLVNRFFTHRANLAGLVERICDCLDELREDCGEYWSVPYVENDKPKYDVLEAKIKAQVTHVNALVILIGQRHTTPDELRKMLLDLLNYCTGGDFESANRKADRMRYMRIVSTINRIAVALHRLKI